MNISEQIIDRVIDISEILLPDECVHQIKRCIIDYTGVLKAGESSLKGRLSRENDAESVLENAMYAGFCAHVLELDDGERQGMLHIGSVVISAVLAVSREIRPRGEDMIHAILCGYEVTITLARMIQPGHKLRGYHATGTCGTIGAAMAAAVLMGYDKKQLMSTLAMAATSSAGLLELIDDSSELKPYNVGRAAMDGVAAAFMGRYSLLSPIDPIGGKRGFIAVLSDANTVDYKPVFQNVDHFNIMDIYVKPYASCRHCHPALEAVLKIRSRMFADGRKIAVDTINAISIYTYSLAIKGHDHVKIEAEASAKMSIPYTTAAALLTGNSGLNSYSENMLTDECINRLMGKISIQEDSEYTVECPKKRAARVEIRCVDGTEYSEKIEYPLGEPENPMSDEQLEKKTVELMTYSGISSAKANDFINKIWDMDGDASFLWRELSI